MINKLGPFLTRSENVYFANKEQASIAVFPAVFCFKHAEQKMVTMYFSKHLLKVFLLTSKSCSWLTFYQMDFMKM